MAFVFSNFYRDEEEYRFMILEKHMGVLQQSIMDLEETVKRGGKKVETSKENDGVKGTNEMRRREKIAEFKERRAAEGRKPSSGGTNWLSVIMTGFFVYQHFFADK